MTKPRIFRPGQPTGALAIAALVATLAACQPPADPAGTTEPAVPTDELGQASYSLGYTVADNIRRQFADELDQEAFQLGFTDGYAEADPRVSEEDARAAMMALQTRQQARQAERSEATAEAGAAFLADNASREGVVTLDSGLQYEVIEAGDGPTPDATDTVTTHYHGTLIDGTVFDSSVERGEPASFPLNRVIPGWTEALQLMSTGAKWRLFIPPELAYGDRSAGDIPPNSTLIFEVELLDIAAAEE